MSRETFYVTTPIYYVNDKPHIGHAYTTVACDTIVRYKKMVGYNTFLLTGTDEHGQKIEETAMKANMLPKELADKNMLTFKALWKTLNIELSNFIRTTDLNHKKYVETIFEKMKANGDIYLGEYTGAYCTPCESYWTETQLLDGNACPDCGRTTSILKERSYFFRLSKYQDRLLKYINDNYNFIKPESRRNEILSFIKEGLKDLSISRVNFKWGIPVKDDPEHIIYVWIDALTSYLTGINYFENNGEKFWPADYHVIGKDILRFHTVYWAAMLMSADIALPKSIFAHGWWTVDGKKMSKSLGNAIDPNFIVSKFSVDTFRYFLMREVAFGLDGDFSYKSLIHRINTDLANDLGNLASRTITMVGKYFDYNIPAFKTETDEEKKVYSSLTALVDIFDKHISDLSFNKALGSAWDIISSLNKYIDDAKPWVLAKDPNMSDKLGTVLYTVLDSIRFLSYFIYPFMPETAGKLLSKLGVKSGFEFTSLDDLRRVKSLTVGYKLSESEALFPRLDAELILKDIMPTDNSVEDRKESFIDFTDFEKVKLKAGKILAAERIVKSDKLLKLSVDCGDGAKIIISGIAKSFEPQELVGKTVTVVTNLKPAKLMGELSNGMILAVTDDKGKHHILTLDDNIAAGTIVK